MTDQTTDQLIRKLERELQNPNIRGDANALDFLLAEDFVEYGSSGKTYTKQQIINSLIAEPDLEVEIKSEVLKRLAPDVILLTYQSVKVVDAQTVTTNRCSIWKKQKGDWKIVFHQGKKTK